LIVAGEADRVRLGRFYSEMTSLDGVMRAIAAEGLDPARVSAADLYSRGLDCHNLGGFAQVEAIAAAVERVGVPGPGEAVLDLGCGMGGPGRFVADRFQCRVVGVDLVEARVEVACALAELTRCGDRVSYRVADATALPFEAESFAQVWMLDASVHVRDKRALLSEIARVLRPGGLLVLHDQMGPLPPTMRPVTRRAPWVAPKLAQLVNRAEEAGLRLMLWQDTTALVREWFRKIQERMGGAAGNALLDACLKTLDGPAGRTGLLVARRREVSHGQ
jgi:ubiquinone/menaquinone biosynthesis C-methylase UbiE